MKNHDKLDWEMLQHAIPNVNHPDLNALSNSGGQKTTIPVTLHKNGDAIFHAEVELFGLAKQLYMPALALVLQELERHQIEIEWDEVTFTNAHAPVIPPYLEGFESRIH